MAGLLDNFQNNKIPMLQAAQALFESSGRGESTGRGITG